MQSKALAGLAALFVAALLVGCGGDENGTTNSGSGATGENTPPAAVAEKIEELKKRVQEAKERRASQQAAGQQGDSGTPPPPPDIEHNDSGGGSAQFRTKGGDNSIQEFGSEASASERDEAAEVLHAFLDSRAARQWATACSYMSVQLIRSFQQLFARAGGAGQSRGCAELLAALSSGVPQRALDEAAEADVGSFRSDGERGFILYHGARGGDYTMPMVMEDGAWKVGALEGSEIF